MPLYSIKNGIVILSSYINICSLMKIVKNDWDRGAKRWITIFRTLIRTNGHYGLNLIKQLIGINIYTL